MQPNLAYRFVTYGFMRLVFVVYVMLHAPSFAANEYVTERLHLIQLIEQDVKATSAYLKKESLDRHQGEP